MNALIVDDSKTIRSILVRVLREMRFECHEAANGALALEVLARIQRPRIVTINWQMPVMDGLELIQRLRSDSLYRDLRLLMVSTEQDPNRIAEAMAAGADAFLAKPFTDEAIKRKLIELGAWSMAEAAASRSAIRVLIVDDSVAIRSILSATLCEDSEIQVVGTAADGQIGLKRVAEVAPDIVLLDVEMPVMDGIAMLRELRRIHPRLPVLMFSSLTERGAKAALDALVAGANDYVAKPKGSSPEDVAVRIKTELIPKIKLLVPRLSVDSGKAPEAPFALPQRRPRTEPIAALVVAVSTGGPSALAEVLPAFVSKKAPPILIVQHMPPVFTSHLAERLTKILGLPVKEAKEGQILTRGDILLAPGGMHMGVVKTGLGVAVTLQSDPPENSCRPAADVLFRSAARVWGAGTLGIVLTGMGRDGLKGSEAIVAAGGAVLAQDEFTSVVWGMPGHVARAGIADAVLPLSSLGVEVAMRLKRLFR